MKEKIFKIYLFIIIFEVLITASVFYSFQTRQADLFLGTGFTVKNLLLFAFVILLLFLTVGILYLSARNSQIIDSLKDYFCEDKRYLLFLVVNFLIFTECFLDIQFFFSEITNSQFYIYYIKLLGSILPLLILIIFLTFQNILLILYLRNGVPEFLPALFVDNKKVIWVFAGIVSYFAFLFFSEYRYISLSDRMLSGFTLGVMKPTNAPIAFEQVAIITIGAFFCWYIIRWSVKKLKIFKGPLYIDILISLLFWICAITIWTSIPIGESGVLDFTYSPVKSVYPISDSFFYDKEAFNLILSGEFLENTTHVMYSFFLMILHKLVGLDVIAVIKLQISILALIPVVIYHLTRSISTRFAGILVGALYIVKESNGLHLSGFVDGSLVNQLMTENLAILGLLLFFVFLVKWIQFPDNRSAYPYLAGSVMGITLLIRAEILAVLIAVCLGALLIFWNDKITWVKGITRIWLVVLIIITPWMIRNYSKTGYFALDKVGFVQRRAAEFLDDITGIKVAINQNKNDYYNEYQTAPKSTSFKILGNQIASDSWQSILFLPSSHQPLLTIPGSLPFLKDGIDQTSSIFSKSYIERYVRTQPYYWYDWNGDIKIRSILPILTTIFFISLGFASIFKERKYSVLILLFAHFSIILLFAATGYSGGRFIKMTEWVILILYGVGLTKLVYLVKGIIISDRIKPYFPEDNQNRRIDDTRRNQFWLVLTVVFILVGLSPVIVEYLSTNQYSNDSLLTRIDTIKRGEISSFSQLDYQYANEISINPEQPLFGKALYVRYFDKDETLADDRNGTIPDSDYSRVDFYLVGTQNIWISLPVDKAIQPIPNYSDVVVFGDLVRTSEIDIREGFLPFSQAREIYIFSDSNGLEKVYCSGTACQPNSD